MRPLTLLMPLLIAPLLLAPTCGKTPPDTGCPELDSLCICLDGAPPATLDQSTVDSFCASHLTDTADSDNCDALVRSLTEQLEASGDGECI